MSTFQIEDECEFVILSLGLLVTVVALVESDSFPNSSYLIFLGCPNEGFLCVLEQGVF